MKPNMEKVFAWSFGRRLASQYPKFSFVMLERGRKVMGWPLAAVIGFRTKGLGNMSRKLVIASAETMSFMAII